MVQAVVMGGNGARPGRGARKPCDSTVPTHWASEMGACVELGNNIFTISLGSKVWDGDTLTPQRKQ